MRSSDCGSEPQSTQEDTSNEIAAPAVGRRRRGRCRGCRWRVDLFRTRSDPAGRRGHACQRLTGHLPKRWTKRSRRLARVTARARPISWRCSSSIRRPTGRAFAIDGRPSTPLARSSAWPDSDPPWRRRYGHVRMPRHWCDITIREFHAATQSRSAEAQLASSPNRRSTRAADPSPSRSAQPREWRPRRSRRAGASPQRRSADRTCRRRTRDGAGIVT